MPDTFGSSDGESNVHHAPHAAIDLDYCEALVIQKLTELIDLSATIASTCVHNAERLQQLKQEDIQFFTRLSEAKACVEMADADLYEACYTGSPETHAVHEQCTHARNSLSVVMMEYFRFKNTLEEFVRENEIVHRLAHLQEILKTIRQIYYESH